MRQHKFEKNKKINKVKIDYEKKEIILDRKEK